MPSLPPSRCSMISSAVSGRYVYVAIILLVLIALIQAWLYSKDGSSKVIRAFRVQLHLIFELFVVLSAWYLWKRTSVLIRSKSIVSFGFITKLFLLVFLLLSLVPMLLVLLPVEVRMIPFISSFCLGGVIFATYLLLASDIIFFLYRLAVRFKDSKRSSPSEVKEAAKARLFLALFGAFLLVCLGAVGAATIVTERVSIPVRGLHSRLNGTTVAQVSDIHLGPFNGRTHLEEIVAMLNSLHPDVVVITGDLVDGSFEWLKETVRPLKNIQSKHGVFFVTGNHEYYTGDVDGWISGLPQFNVSPLVNERVCLLGSHDLKSSSCEGGFYLAGLEDIETRRKRYGSHSMDLHSALSGRTTGVPTIVLAHQPWAAVEAVMWKDVSLVLSGHTHGGQILPMFPLVYLYNPYFVGLYEPSLGVYVYVNPGTLSYVVPFRHFSKSEITLFTLLSS